MTWMHCLNCGWQGANNAGKSEKVVGGLLTAAGLALGIGLHNWIWGGIALGIGVIALLIGLGAGASLACPHCQSTDIKKYQPSIAEKTSAAPDERP